MTEAVGAFLVAHQAVIGLIILAAMFVGFVVERFAPSVVAVLGAASLLALGLLDERSAFAVFSNSAPLTIGAMFILSGALIRTGVIDKAASYIVARAARHPRLAVIELFGGALFASAFLNNTPVVVVLIPITIRLAETLGISPKKLLMPLSIVAVLGGCLTLIGTSTNLVVDGIAQEAGLEPFGLFEITPYALVVAIAGIGGLIAMVGLLPSDRAVAIDGQGGSAEQDYLTELVIGPEDARIGRAYGDLKLFNGALSLLGVRRGKQLTRMRGLLRGRHNDQIMVQAGDRIVVRASGAALLTLHEEHVFGMGLGDGAPQATHVVEAMVAPSHPAIGQRLADIPFLQKLRVRVLGVTRLSHFPGPTLADVRIRAADRLLIEADDAGLRGLQDNPHLVGLSAPRERAFRPRRAWIAVAALLGTILLAAFNVTSIGVAAIIAVAVILVTRCIDAAEAWNTIDGDVLILIFAMLAVGSALERSGSVALLVDAVIPAMTIAPSWAVVAIVYFSAVLLSELLSNNAVAALLAPIVIALAAQLGLDPRTLLIALMLGASACFATPVGYQTNALVYAAGSYRFIDFVRIGVPLNILTGLAGCIAIALIG